MSKIGSAAGYAKAAAPVGSAPQQAMSASGCGLGRGGWYASPPNPLGVQTPAPSADVPGNIAAALMTAASKSGSPAMPPPAKRNRWSMVKEGAITDSSASQLSGASATPSPRSTTSTQHPPLKLPSSGSGLAPGGGSGSNSTAANSLAFAENRRRLAKGIGKGIKSDEGAEAADKEVEQAI